MRPQPRTGPRQRRVSKQGREALERMRKGERVAARLRMIRVRSEV